MRTFESQLTKSRAELLVPPEGTLLGAIVGMVFARSIAFGEFHIDVFSVAKLTIEKCGVKIEYFDIPAVLCWSI